MPESVLKSIDPVYTNQALITATHLQKHLDSMEQVDFKKSRLYVYYNQRFGVTQRGIEGLQRKI